MKCIVGLGNPGKAYEETRHNVGFAVVDALSRKWKLPLRLRKYEALLTEGTVEGENVLLVKPMTYMNRSGEAVSRILHGYGLDLDALLVIYDDMDLPPGSLRLRLKGSAGGHNGMKSVIQHLGSQEFKRLRMGIGHPQKGRVIDYVLSPFMPAERPLIEESVEKAAEAITAWLNLSFDVVMSQYNSR